MGGGGDKRVCMYLRLKDSNAAVRVRKCATLKAPDGYDRWTNKQTDKLSAHYSKMASCAFLCNICVLNGILFYSNSAHAFVNDGFS